MSSPDATAPARDPDAARRRHDAILHVAIGHFARDGFAGTDLDAVAAELACAKGTLYRYFKNKRDLFLQAADFAMRGLVEAASPRPELDPWEQVEHGVRDYLAYFAAHPEYVELIMQERAEFKDRPTPTYYKYRDANRSRWQPVLQQLIRSGRFRAISPEQALDVIGDTLYGTIFTNHFAGRTKSLEAQADDVLDLLFHGLASRSERTAPRRRT